MTARKAYNTEAISPEGELKFNGYFRNRAEAQKARNYCRRRYKNCYIGMTDQTHDIDNIRAYGKIYNTFTDFLKEN